MKAYRDWIGSFASVVTIVSFVASLSMSRRVWKARNSSGVALWPVASATICLHAWMTYGSIVGDLIMMWVNAIGFVLMGFNLAVHRRFSHTTGPGLATVAAIGLVSAVPLMMSVAWLRRMALLWTVICNLAPIQRIVLTMPLPDIAAWTMINCTLWTVHAFLQGDVALIMTNLFGAEVAFVEVVMAIWRKLCCEVNRPIETVL
ncbi:hypothetical protein HPB50_007018 [Hyalomma asiaticum]|uniref:Uncharacterized protein n=1 Tax=Hyalomma asiaticum TaxID=266040 RepID=A0ACB7TFP4_HYAAI|nr:hypothetical protein HPB50_007018 [Hyalomma asiaticum]